MNIGVDTRHLEMMAGTGGTQVMYHGLRALRQYDAENCYLSYAKRVGQWGARHPRLSPFASAYADLLHKNMVLPWWAQYKHIDLLLYYPPPCSYTIRKIPQICHILDVPPPQESNTGRNWFYNRFFIRNSAMVADHIITISRFSKGQICSCFGLSPDKISIVNPCIDLDSFRPRQDTKELQIELRKQGVAPGYYFGVISNLIPRKNPGGYLEIFSRLPPKLRKARKLVLVGVPTTLDDFKPYVNASVLQAIRDDVVILGRVALDDLPRLYSMASVLLFPSTYEGFGLPVVEAAACGTDVIASSIPAVKEAASPAAFLFDPDNYDAMTECLVSLNAQSSSERTAVHLNWAKRFGYPSYAAKMREAYNRTLTQKPQPSA